MKKIILLTIVFACIHIQRSQAIIPNDSVNIAKFGKVFIYRQTEIPRYVVIIISGDGGWNYGVVGFADTFSKMNSLVIGVDILRYYKDLRQRTDDCYIIAADFVQLATVIEKKYNFPEYLPPLIMGYSSGASLVYGILAQARPGTFIGGISLGFCPDIKLPKMFCQINGLTERVDIPGKKYIFLPDPKLGNPWIVLQGKLDNTCSYSDVTNFVNKTANTELITLPDVGHGFSKLSDFMTQWKEAFNSLIDKYEKIQPTIDNTEKIRDIPVVFTNAKFQKKDAPVALLISGDGGWYGFEQSIADNLADLGIPTLGLNSKKYFWNRRSKEETTNDMGILLDYYSKKWGKDRFLLIGYSLGAEIVPFIANGLPADLKSKIVSAVLLSPDIHTDFEIHISNMLGMGNRQNTYNVPEEINKMHTIPTLCIFGENEKSQVPGLLSGASIKIKIIPGDHHYKFNLPLIVQTMKDNKAL